MEEKEIPEWVYRSEDKKMGIYSDIARIGFNPFTFFFDFGQMLPPEEKGRRLVVARIVMSPEHAKAFFKILEQNIAIYEKQLGEIKVPEEVQKIPEEKEE